MAGRHTGLTAKRELRNSLGARDLDLLIASDQSIRFQQNLLRQSITVLTVTTNDWYTIRTNISLVRNAMETAQQGENNPLSLKPLR